MKWGNIDFPPEMSDIQNIIMGNSGNVIQGCAVGVRRIVARGV